MKTLEIRHFELLDTNSGLHSELHTRSRMGVLQNEAAVAASCGSIRGGNLRLRIGDVSGADSACWIIVQYKPQSDALPTELLPPPV